MHSHQMAHLDISLHNILTDYKGRYAFIDFECCRRFDGIPAPLVRGARGTDIPPELERGEWADPYKADVWSLAVLIHRACKVCEFWKVFHRKSLIELPRQITGYNVPELVTFTRPMLHDDYNRRPSAASVLRAFDAMVTSIHGTT